MFTITNYMRHMCLGDSADALYLIRNPSTKLLSHIFEYLVIYCRTFVNRILHDTTQSIKTKFQHLVSNVACSTNGKAYRLNLVVCILLRVLDQVQGFPSNATLFQ
jgi:hypothetical protein